MPTFSSTTNSINYKLPCTNVAHTHGLHRREIQIPWESVVWLAKFAFCILCKRNHEIDFYVDDEIEFWCFFTQLPPYTRLNKNFMHLFRENAIISTTLHAQGEEEASFFNVGKCFLDNWFIKFVCYSDASVAAAAAG